jgi:tRNA A-37 threonylcarbamoyl transferase component Bud32/tetratricopeptide (TPR) repeat protein
MRAGTRLGPYEIVAAIGAGGMGEVFKARDERLARDVAIKVVAEYSTDSARARERFKREARAVAALQHPNICAIYDVGETADGRAFIVMELLQGETLRQRIANGPLDQRVILEVGVALADALQAAHSAGIVHRDLKPANILLTSRGPKILDFGLAKTDPRVPSHSAAEELEDRALLTEAGSAVGTLAYMSPEQLRGEEVDARTDLFSLGLVLYEMATGRPTFVGNSAVVGAAILHEQPVPPRTIRLDLPEGFQQVVLKALEKDRDLRYQTAADIRADLQRQKRSSEHNAGPMTEVAVPAQRYRSKRARSAAVAAALAAAVVVGYWAFTRSSTPMLAETDAIVLGDFTNTTGDAVFDQALREGLMVALQQSPFLHVLADQRVRRLLTMMGRSPDSPLISTVALEVCERSGGAAVIEGSIASLGDQYILGLRATDCRSGELLDTQQSQVPGKQDVLGALGGMAREFRARAGESLATIQTHGKPLPEATTVSLEALKAYSAARAPGLGCGGVPLLQRAIELDPVFALAQAMLAVCYSGTGQRQLAIQAATRAYELRERATDPERFFIEYAYERDVTGDLEKAFQTATVWTQTYPRDLNAYGLRGGYSAHGTGRYEEAIQSAQRALAIEPGFVFAYRELVSANMFVDRFDASKQALESAGPAVDAASLAIGYYIAMLEHESGGIEPFAARLQDSSEVHLLRHAESLTLARAGQLERARALAREAIDAAEGLGQHETAAIYESAAAVWEALWGNRSTSTRRATTALERSSQRDVTYANGVALALAGEVARSESLASDLERRFPRDTLVRFTYLPTLRALAAIARNEPVKAIELLQANVAYERAVPWTAFNFFFGSLYPVYVRAQAYAANGQNQEAVVELQKILDHRGLMMGDPVGARALLDKARMLARAGDQMGARVAYDDFLSLWKDADPDALVLAQARAESAALPGGD